MLMPTVTIEDVEKWNDTFALEHDIDDYYNRSGFIIRFVERRRLAIIKAMVSASSGDRILEVGCGGGHVLQLFPQAHLTGVDVSGQMLQKAKRNLKGYQVDLLKGELHRLDLHKQHFDTVIASEVLEHVVDPDAVLASMRELLKPGGRVIITLPNDHLVNTLKSVIRKTGLTSVPPFRRIAWGGDHYHLHQWRVRGMIEMLQRHFAVKQIRFAPSRLLPIRCCFLCKR